MLIEDLPEDLKKLALKRQLEENDLIDEGADLCSAEHAFTWESTPEGTSFWDLVDEGLFTEARESLIGRKIKGFRFDESSTSIFYNYAMYGYVGMVGRVIDINDGIITLKFEDGVTWGYPTVLALDHLLPKGSVDQDTEECVKPVESGEKQRVFETGSKSEDKDNKIRVFDSGSKRDSDEHKPLVNHFDAYCRLRFGYRLRDGANKYDKGNWRKLQPDEAALEALNRHLAYYELNMQNEVEQDEDHLAAIIFNVMLLMKNEEKRGVKPDQYFGTTK